MDKLKHDSPLNSPTVKCVKKALIREAGVPLGQDAELNINCDCGSKVPIRPPLWDRTLNKCATCDTVLSPALLVARRVLKMDSL